MVFPGAAPAAEAPPDPDPDEPSVDAPTITVEYAGTGSGLQAAIDALPDGGVLGLVLHATYNLGSGMLTIDDRHGIAIVGRGSTIQQTTRQHTEIIQVNGGSTDIALWDLTIQGANPDPGHWDPSWEHNHGVALRGIPGFEMANVDVVNVSGDGVYISGLIDTDLQSSNVRIHDCSFSGIGRNGISITDGYDIVIEDSSFEFLGLHTWDVEPNGLTLEGIASGGVDVHILNNTVGTEPYGDYPDDSTEQLGYMFVATDASGGGPAKQIEIDGNTITGGAMRVACFSADAEDWVITDNESTVSFTSETDITTVVNLNGIVNVHVTGNTQDVISGSFVSTSGCSGTVVTTPNTT